MEYSSVVCTDSFQRRIACFVNYPAWNGDSGCVVLIVSTPRIGTSYAIGRIIDFTDRAPATETGESAYAGDGCATARSADNAAGASTWYAATDATR